MTEDERATSDRAETESTDTTDGEGASDPDAIEASDGQVSTASVSSDYKVRGKKAATSGAGVLGHNTASTGPALGVEGLTESSGSDAAGVRAVASNGSGATFGLEAVTQSNAPSGVAVKAEAPNGAKGLKSTASNNIAIDASATGNTAIYSQTDGVNYNAVHGQNSATSGKSWGVRGDSNSDHPEAYGVYGEAKNTLGSGNGVGGITNGESDGAAGVYGEAKGGSGKTFGVEGVTQSSDRDAAAVEAKAPNGAVGLRSSTTGYLGLEVNTSNFTGIKANVDGPSRNAIEGENTATTGFSWGVFGKTNSSSVGAYGVRGDANNASGKARGVGGFADGYGDDSVGVYGEATDSSGKTYGVNGITQSTDAGAVGVRGEAAGSSGNVFGVDGITQSSSSAAAGVRGTATDDNHGVVGRIYDTESNLPSLDTFDAAAVFGTTDRSGTGNHYGVVGWSKNSTGVLAKTEDADKEALKVENTAGGPGIDVTNAHVDVDNVGVSAYLSGNQSIPDSDLTNVKFDAIEDIDFGSFDKNNGIYTVPVAGDYHVDFLIDWSDTFAESDSIKYELQINGSPNGGLSAETTVATSTAPSDCFSKTLFDVPEGATLLVEIFQQSGGSKDIFGNSFKETYLTIHKVG